MKRLLALVCCLLLLPLFTLAQEAPEPLKLAEVEQFSQALLERALVDELPPFSGDGGYLARGSNYEVLLSGEDLSADSVVLSAALLLSSPGHEEGEEQIQGPRGSHPGMALEELLALFPNDNPPLAGSQTGAVLYIAGELPAAVSAGSLLRDGQQVQLVEYAVYYQAGEGVMRAGFQYTLEKDAVTAIRSFTNLEVLSLQAATEELAGLRALQEENTYIAFGSRDGSRLAREDLVLAGLDLLDTDYDSAVLALGAPNNEERISDADGGTLIIGQWLGVEAVFTQKEGQVKAQRLSVNQGAHEGPRGLRVGDTLAQAMSRFEHSGELGEAGGALYGEADSQTAPYGLMVKGIDTTQLYYVVETASGNAALILEFIDDLLVSLTLTYL